MGKKSLLQQTEWISVADNISESVENEWKIIESPRRAERNENTNKKDETR